MSSTNFVKRFLLIAGRILILLLVLAGAVRSGTPASYYDPYGFFFVLIGGVALIMISFPGAEIWRAFRHATVGSDNEAELKNAAHFWEAAGRGFWILGGLSSVLSIMTSFAAMKTEETAGMAAIVPMLIRCLLSTLYGSLLAVICFVPCWKLMGKLQSRLSASGAEGGEAPAFERSGRHFGTLIGYVLFLAVLVLTVRLPNVSISELLTVCVSPFLVVLGGTLALMLFMGGNSARLTPSTAFAGMGLIGSLMGFIQMLHGMTDPSPRGIGKVAWALAFILASCFTALLGMAIIGAPLEDRVIRIGRVTGPSAFSRVSWYVFPLLSLIFLVLVYTMIILPLPPAH
ncbi:MAG: MotA/TolQ/ExbB proton channel family protein [Acidobacteriota bacterium]